jgi:hypothetical protein
MERNKYGLISIITEETYETINNKQHTFHSSLMLSTGYQSIMPEGHINIFA